MREKMRYYEYYRIQTVFGYRGVTSGGPGGRPPPPVKSWGPPVKFGCLSLQSTYITIISFYIRNVLYLYLYNVSTFPMYSQVISVYITLVLYTAGAQPDIRNWGGANWGKLTNKVIYKCLQKLLKIVIIYYILIIINNYLVIQGLFLQ